MLTCCRYIGRLLIAPSLPRLIHHTLPCLGALTQSLRSGLELCRDFLGDLRPPFLHRFETRQGSAVRLGLADEFVLGPVEVDLETARLRDIPRRVAEHLDAIAFGVVKINRPGIAVANGSQAL